MIHNPCNSLLILIKAAAARPRQQRAELAVGAEPGAEARAIRGGVALAAPALARGRLLAAYLEMPTWRLIRLRAPHPKVIQKL